MGERLPSQNAHEEVAEQPLDSSFVFLDAKNYRKYFKKGKVFRTLWPEPANSTEQDRDRVVNAGKWGEQMIVKIHWFVVVQSFPGHCLVVPVHTYDGRGATKPGINVDDHCALVAKGQSMMLLDGERLNRAPLHLIVENSDIPLKSSSRINFSKVHTVEYNIKISTVGRIAPEDVPTLSDYWHQSITKGRRENASSRSVRFGKPQDGLHVQSATSNDQQSRGPIRPTTSTFHEATHSTKSAHNQHWQSIVYQEPAVQNKPNLDWLTSTTDYTSRHMELAKTRQPKTGEWLLACPKYQNWRKSNGGTLFCPGFPGSRKTILTAVVVDDLHSQFSKDQTVGVCYLYSDSHRRENQKLPQLISSFVKQLVQKHPQFASLIAKMDNKFDMFGAIVTRLVRTFIVIDALDELEGASGTDQTVVKELLHLQVRHGINLLVTSRVVPSVTRLFENAPALGMHSIHSEIEILMYVGSQIPNLPEFVQNDPKLQRDILFRICYAADGIFLLARFFLKHLMESLAEMSAEAIYDALKSLKTSSSALENAWRDSIDRVVHEPADRQELAKDVFMWITCAQSPLTASELRHALAVDIGDQRLRPEDIPSLDDMLSACAGFVIIEKGTGIISMVNTSVKNFVTQNQSRWFPNAHERIANTCAIYLLLQDSAPGCAQSEAEFQCRFDSFPFYAYASRHWGYHARLPSAMDFMKLMNDSPGHVQAWYQSILYCASEPALFGGVHSSPGNVSLLHIAAFLDQDMLIGRLLGVSDFEAKDGQGRTPLFYAAARGSVRALKRLLEFRVKVGAEDKDGRTPLYWAVHKGQAATARLLRKTGAVMEGDTLLEDNTLEKNGAPAFEERSTGSREICVASRRMIPCYCHEWGNDFRGVSTPEEC